MGSNLLIFNFVLDLDDPLLSHQHDAVSALAKNFDEVTVITGKTGLIALDSKIRIVSTNWVPGDYLGNLTRLMSRALPIIIKGNFDSVFYHMTDLQCAVLSPLVWLRSKKQFLWYAHTVKSKYLIFSSWWVTKVVTSTVGSCPLKGPQVLPIGQAIDSEMFSPLPFNELDLLKLIHIGRFDKSKNIQLLIESARELKRLFPRLSLTLIGSPANAESAEWAKRIVRESESELFDGWLEFKESIPRRNFSKEVSCHGSFFHGYVGSLDKTLVESTMLRVPVVTINPEYLASFGSWSKSNELTLVSEYIAMKSMSEADIQQELNRRLLIAKSEHSLKHWVERLTELLK